MKAKKFLIIILSVISITCAAIGLAACDSCTEAHTHTFSETWSYDATYHWHDATCGHDVTDGKAEHTYTNNVCTVCGYTTTTTGAGGGEEDGSGRTDGETITISFNTLGGENVDSITITSGESIFELVPSGATKEGVVFDQWYLDEALTKPLFDTDYIFTEDTTLYAGYTEKDTSDVTVDVIDEYSIFDQPTDVKLYISGNGSSLSTSKLSSVLTVENLGVLVDIPDMTISTGTSVGGESCYVLSANWQKGGKYTLTLAEPYVFLVVVEEGSFKFERDVSTLNIYLETIDNYSVATEASTVVEVSTSKYYSVSSDDIYLDQTFAYENGLQPGDTVKIMLEDGSYGYAVLGNMSATTIGSKKAIYAELECPDDMSLMYDELEFVNNEDYSIASVAEENIDETVVLESLMNSEGIYDLLDYGLVSTVDYATTLGIDVDGAVLTDGTKLLKSGVTSAKTLAKIDILPAIKIWTQERAEISIKQGYFEGTNIPFSWTGYEDSTFISFDWTVKISNKTSATISMLIQYAGYYRLASDGNIFSFSVIVGDEVYSSIDFDIILVHDGVTYSAREDTELGKYTTSEFCERYRTLINLDNDIELTATLFTFCINLDGLIQIEIPLSLNITLSVNGSFAVSVDHWYYKTFGIKAGWFQSAKGYKGEVFNMQSVALYYEGMFGFKLGFTIGVRVSVLNLMWLFSVGFDFSAGFYMDFYGAGYSDSGYSYFIYWDLGKDEHWQLLEGTLDMDVYKPQEYEWDFEWGASFIELGIYFEFDVVAESQIFGASASATLIETKIPLYKAGDQYLILDFSEELCSIEDTYIVMNQYEVLNLSEYFVNYFTAMDVKTGEIVQVQGVDEYMRIEWQINVDGVKTTYGGYQTTAVISAPQEVIDGTCDYATFAIRVSYKGPNRYGIYTGNWWYLSILGEFYYEKPDPYEGVEYHTVTLMYGDDVFKTVEVHEGTSVYYELIEWQGLKASSLNVTSEWLAANTDYSNAWFKTADLQQAIYEDTVIYAYLKPRSVKIYYNFATISAYDNTIEYDQSYVYGDAGASLYTALADVNTAYITPHENYVFAGWDTADTTVHYGDGYSYNVTALYEPKDITITVIVNEDTISGRSYGIPGTFTYSLPAGSQALVVDDHVGIYGGNYLAYVSQYPDGVESTAAYVYDDVSFTISWTYSEYWATFYDKDNNAIMSEPLVPYKNALYLLEDDELITKAGGYFYYDSNGVRYEIVGWSGIEQLSYVTRSVSIYAVYHKAEREITFNATGGYLYANYQAGTYTLTRNYGDELTDGFIDWLEPKKAPTASTAYTFAGWYYLDDNGNKVYEIETTVQNDRTYYADWTESENDITITLYASNYSSVIGGDGGINGKFESTGATERRITMTYSEYLTLADIMNTSAFDYETPVSTDSDDTFTYVFDHWMLVYRSLYPVYGVTQTNGGETTYVYVSYDLVGGTNQYFTSTDENGNTVEVSTKEYASNTFNDGNGGLYIELQRIYEPSTSLISGSTVIYAAYEDDAYYYTFSHWSVSINGGTAADYSSGERITVTKNSVISITAVYTATAKTFSYTFIIYSQNISGEYTPTYDITGKYVQALYLNGSVINYYQYTLYAKYGETLSESDIPTAVYDLYDLDYVNHMWAWVFKYWGNTENGSTTVDMTVTGNRTYRAYFSQETLYYDITFDAGEGAVFQSTGTQTRTITVSGGTTWEVAIGTLGENPVRTDSKYVLSYWDYSVYQLIVYGDETLHAYYWNTEENCLEGFEDYVTFYLDAGYGGIVQAGGYDSRFYEVDMKIGWTVDLDTLCNYLVEIDGVIYSVVWEITDGTEVTADLDGKVISYKTSSMTVYG